MAINKSRTPAWMKAVLILLAAVFVFGFVSIGTVSCTDDATTGTQTDPIAAINAQYEPQVTALKGMLQSQPESYTVLIALARAHQDWGMAVYDQSQTSSEAASVALSNMTAARQVYEQALAIDKKDSSVVMDYTIMLYFTGDISKAASTAAEVTKVDAEYAPAWYWTGVYNAELGNKDVAIDALEKAIKIDPDGKIPGNNPTQAKTMIEELKAQ